MSYIPHVMGRIRNLPGVLSVDLGAVGEVNVCLEGQDRALRAEVLRIGASAMLPVRVFYRMPDGRTIGEDVSDYYKTIKIPGFADTTPSEAPPEEVAAEPKGALKLKRLRGKTRGRPVLGWKYGDKEVRKGTEIRFKAPADLRWTMGRTLGVKPGATAKVVEISTTRPIVYLALGGYDGIECPVHSIGHVFDINSKDKKPKSEAKERKGAIDNQTGYKGSEIARMVNTVGFGQNPSWGRPDDDNTAHNSPHFGGPENDGPATAKWDDPEVEEEDCGCSTCSKEPAEDMLAPPGDSKTAPQDQRFSKSNDGAQRVILFGRK